MMDTLSLFFGARIERRLGKRSMRKYPLFLLPEQLGLKDRWNWDAKEAGEYREWLLGVMDGRVDQLVRLLGEPRGDSPSDHLMRLGTKAVPLLKRKPYSKILDRPDIVTLRAGGEDREVVHKVAGERELAEAGWSLAMDMGLLLAQYFLQAFPHASWHTVRKPKDHIDYNLPVLGAILSFAGLEPTRLSVVVARGILDDTKGEDGWKLVYEFYLEACGPGGRFAIPAKSR